MQPLSDIQEAVAALVLKIQLRTDRQVLKYLLSEGKRFLKSFTGNITRINNRFSPITQFFLNLCKVLLYKQGQMFSILAKV